MFQWILLVISLLLLVLQWKTISEGYIDSANQYDIIIVAGQSNSLGWSNEAARPDGFGNIASYNRSVFTSADLTNNPKISILERDPAWPLNSNRVSLFANEQSIINGSGIYNSVEPMSYHSTSWNVRPSIGFYKTFATRYSAANPTRKVLIIHNGFEATGMSTPFNNHPFIKDGIIQWNVGGNLYNTMVRRVKRVLSWNSGNKVVALLWSQGEADIDANYSAANYKTTLNTFVTRLRTDIGSGDFPFIACGYSETWHQRDTFTQRKNDYMSNVKSMSCTTYDGQSPTISGTVRSGTGILPKFGFVSTVGVQTDIANQNNVHFNFAGLRELGERFWRVYSVIK